MGRHHDQLSEGLRGHDRVRMLLNPMEAEICTGVAIGYHFGVVKWTSTLSKQADYDLCREGCCASNARHGGYRKS